MPRLLLTLLVIILASGTPAKSFHLVAFNIGKLKAPLGSVEIKEFEVALGPINDLALLSEGFVWQLNMEPHERQNTGVRTLDEDALLMPQLSLWTDAELLSHYVVKSGHGSYLKRRKEWFDKLPEPYGCCYWRSSDLTDRPSLKEAFEKLDFLKSHGSTPASFHFRELQKFSDPSSFDPEDIVGMGD